MSLHAEEYREQLLERQSRYLIDPSTLYPIFYWCNVKILIVTDGGGRFGLADFGLKGLLDALAVPVGPWMRFAVTKAHRATDPDADLQQFRFDAHDLRPYDQIWMFGVARTGGTAQNPPLSDQELRAVSEFMDGGGGVFATGDHEDLGVAMCGRVPRVRTMRKWHWPNPGPNGEPVAPNVGGTERYDTLSAGNDPGITFDDQSDDIPQRITPRMYSLWGWNPWFHRVQPHPVLCGPRGVIRVLPDHPHEGECYVPSDLTATFTFNGYTITEYPSGIAPEIIAWSHLTGDATVSRVKGPLTGRTFGAIGAYDGHVASVGRVVVDATWHHFFNVNLIGELGNADPIKGIGFSATTSGQLAFEDIKAYYRNIGVWLARPATINCMWWAAMWWCRWHHRVFMDLRPYYLEKLERLDIHEYIRIGGEARDVLGRVASQCTVRWWIWHQIIRCRPELRKPLERYVDPWLPRPEPSPRPGPGPDPLPNVAAAIHVEILLDAVMGAITYSVAKAFPDATDDARAKAQETRWEGIVGRSVESAIHEVAAHLLTSSEEISGIGAMLANRKTAE
jgi:hypothetical protein